MGGSAKLGGPRVLCRKVQTNVVGRPAGRFRRMKSMSLFGNAFCVLQIVMCHVYIALRLRIKRFSASLFLSVVFASLTNCSCRVHFFSYIVGRRPKSKISVRI